VADGTTPDVKLAQEVLRNVAAGFQASANGLTVPPEMTQARRFAPTGFSESRYLFAAIMKASDHLKDWQDAIAATLRYRSDLLLRAADLFPELDKMKADEIKAAVDKLADEAFRQPTARSTSAPPTPAPPNPPA
jgi:hypothetical protein